LQRTCKGFCILRVFLRRITRVAQICQSVAGFHGWSVSVDGEEKFGGRERASPASGANPVRLRPFNEAMVVKDVAARTSGHVRKVTEGLDANGTRGVHDFDEGFR